MKVKIIRNPDFIDLEELFISGVVEENQAYRVEEDGELFIVVNGYYFNHNEYEVVEW